MGKFKDVVASYKKVSSSFSSNKIHRREELRKDKANFLKIIYMKRSDIKENKGNDFISKYFLSSSSAST